MNNIKKFKCVCAYDGTSFCGWQAQPSKNAIQDLIEIRLAEIFKEKIRIHASGRTDAGVHADAQVFHFDASWNHSDEALLKALKSKLPQTLQIISLEETNSDFHSRYSAQGKQYIYNIRLGDSHPKNARFEWQFNRHNLDIDAINNASKILLGTHDFTSFSASRGENVKENPVKTLYELKATQNDNLVTISTKGSGYMYKMVRLLVGALVNVGLGKLNIDDIVNILNAKNRNINKFQAVPAKGLTLRKVYYKNPPMDIKAVIFDFDGVLVDTEKLYNTYWRQAAKDLGYDLSCEKSLELRSLDKNLAIKFFKDLFGEDCNYDAIRNKRIQLMNETVKKYGIEQKEGVVSLLKTLKAKNIKIAICSASDYQTIENNLKLADIANNFDEIISVVSVKRGKPFADVYLQACDILKLNPNQTLVVEDSPNGVRSASAAGCNVVMIPDLTQPTEELNKILTMTLKNLNGLENWILENL